MNTKNLINTSTLYFLNQTQENNDYHIFISKQHMLLPFYLIILPGWILAKIHVYINITVSLLSKISC
jgi:hypothetical protein